MDVHYPQCTYVCFVVWPWPIPTVTKLHMVRTTHTDSILVQRRVAITFVWIIRAISLLIDIEHPSGTALSLWKVLGWGGSSKPRLKCTDHTPHVGVLPVPSSDAFVCTLM